ncbi:MAG: MFS transporter [Solirubrobacterales bacterium]
MPAILTGLSLGAIAFALMQSLVVPAMPVIQKVTGGSETSVSWILTGYLLVASVATPIIGRLGDVYGKQRVLVYCLAGVAVGIVVTGLFPSNLTLLIIGRSIMGLGGGIFPLAFAIIRDDFPPERIASGIGFLSSLIGAASGFGIVIAGLIIEYASYELIYWIPLLAVVPAIALAKFVIPESPRQEGSPINWFSAALMSIGLGAVLVAITEAVDWGWGAPRTLALIAFGLAFIGFWIANEVRSPVALVDMGMMRLRGIWTTNLVAFLVGIGMYASFLLVPLLVQEPESTGYGFGADVIHGALYVLPMAVTMLLAGQIVGPIEARVGSRPALLAGCLITAISFLMLVPWHSTAADIYISSALMGLGIGLAYATLATLVVENADPTQTGVASGMNNVLRTVGGAFGGQIAATILASNTLSSGRPSEDAFVLAFVMCGVATLAAFGAGFAIPRRGRVFDPHDVALADTAA